MTRATLVVQTSRQFDSAASPDSKLSFQREPLNLDDNDIQRRDSKEICDEMGPPAPA